MMNNGLEPSYSSGLGHGRPGKRHSAKTFVWQFVPTHWVRRTLIMMTRRRAATGRSDRVRMY